MRDRRLAFLGAFRSVRWEAGGDIPVSPHEHANISLAWRELLQHHIDRGSGVRREVLHRNHFVAKLEKAPDHRFPLLSQIGKRRRDEDAHRDPPSR